MNQTPLRGLGFFLVVLFASARAVAPVVGSDLAPFPVTRILLPSDRLAVELARVKQGVLVQMPLTDFEERLARARKSVSAAGAAPRLIQSFYRASLKDSALIGTADWKILHNGVGTAFLPLQAPDAIANKQFNLAIQRARFTDGDAMIGDFESRTHVPMLAVNGPGEHILALDWSARSDQRPEGLAFRLNVPESPAAELELELPSDRSVTADGALVSGPLRATKDENRLWKIGFGGRDQVVFLIRQAIESRPPLVLVTHQTTQQTLLPDAMEARFDFDLEMLHRGVRELVCECDPSLKPYEISVRNLNRWEIAPPVSTGKPALLKILLRDPLYEGTLSIRCLAPLGEPRDAKQPGQIPLMWSSPSIRILNAAQQGELLTLRFHPDLRLENWQLGNFRVVESTVETDGLQLMKLSGGGVVSEVIGPRRPSALVFTHGVEFRAMRLRFGNQTSSRMYSQSESHTR